MIKKMSFALKNMILPIIVISALIISYNLIFNAVNTENASRIGSRGEEVKIIQQKLTDFGLYTGRISGVYDVETSEAIRRFQIYNGLEGSGICDPETKTLLSLSVGKDELTADMLAKFIFHRCGNVSYLTKCACGAYIVNRSSSPGFPNGIIENIISEAGADFDYSIRPDEKSYSAALAALAGSDPTDGALYMSNPNSALPGNIYPTLVNDSFSFGK